ncbi:MAG: NAD-dependent DNA ligase LigA, partial [Sporomusaceae bacterium]|nr:NAD-dependent DNA ligase LigA [Sporomusaceae bacterium]
MGNNLTAAASAAALREKINYHSYRYHCLDAPVITDAEFDLLYRELVELEAKYPQLVTADSPTQRVGAAAAAGFKQSAHLTPMLSLANAFSAEELRSFDQRLKNALEQDQIEYTAELKIDGLAINLLYENG